MVCSAETTFSKFHTERQSHGVESLDKQQSKLLTNTSLLRSWYACRVTDLRLLKF